ncbi:hypothetical protein F1559_004169 [Cyanidiococcus yangmingshanensis]|uniref:RRM domain-containing protein n=1 Tax=Cyanidiococcus yangmingshanensis TaxID=2690220 RepID=A0A7J7IKY8_9RHOD|nr:hypothetical protein F1559_004169 [Cyanidiococcus yangmingshanensis]
MRSCSGLSVDRLAPMAADEGVSGETRPDAPASSRVYSTRRRRAEATKQPVPSKSTTRKIGIDECDKCIEAATARHNSASLIDANSKPAADLREIVLKQRIRDALETTRAHRDLSMEKIRTTEPKQDFSTIRPSGTDGVQRESAPGRERRDERADKWVHSNGLHRTMNGSRGCSPETERSLPSKDKERGTGARRAVQSIDRDRLERVSSQTEAYCCTERVPRGMYSSGSRMNARRQHPSGYQGAPVAPPDHRSSIAKTFDRIDPAKRAQRRTPDPESSSSRPVRERRSGSTEDGDHPSIPLTMERIAKQAAFVVQAAAAASTTKPSDEALAGAGSSARSEAEQLCWLWLHGPDVGSQPARRVVLRNLPPSATEDALYLFLVHVMAAACCFSYDYVRWYQHYNGWSERHHRGAAMTAAAGRFGPAKRRQYQPAEQHRIAVASGDEIAPLLDDHKILSLLKLTPIWDLQLVAKRRMAFVECLTVSEATGLVRLNGLLFQGHQLLIRRPREFDADSWFNASGLSKRDQEALRHPPPRFCPAHIEANVVSPDVSMNEVLPAPANVFYGYIGQIPFHLTEYTIIHWLRNALVEWPWRLTAFRLAREANSGLSRGFAFFVSMPRKRNSSQRMQSTKLKPPQWPECKSNHHLPCRPWRRRHQLGRWRARKTPWIASGS